MTDVPTSGNSPHHLTPSLDGKTVVGGGLLSLLKTQDTAFYFDTSNPYRPTFKSSNRGILSSIVDEIRAKPDGYVQLHFMYELAGLLTPAFLEASSSLTCVYLHPFCIPPPPLFVALFSLLLLITTYSRSYLTIITQLDGQRCGNLARSAG